MGKFNTAYYGKDFRTTDQITEDYLNDLIKKGLIDEENADHYRTKEGRDELLKILLEKLYEVEEHKGVLISTLDSFYHFCEYIIRRDPVSRRKVWNNLVKNLFLDIERNRYCSILASRGLGKSFFVYGVYPSFKAFLYRYTDIMLVSNIPKMCVRNIRVLKRIIDSNELLLTKKEVEKGKELKWTESEIEYNGGIIESQSVGTPARSAHLKYIFCDDILRDDNKIPEEDLENFVLGQLIPTAQRYKARLVLTGTPMHLFDIYHRLMNTKEDFKGSFITDGGYGYNGFYSKTYPIITDWENKEIFLPDLFSWEELITNKNSVKNIQGDDKFNREYLLICTDKSSVLFSEKLVKSSQDESYKVVGKGEEGKSYIIAADVATSGSASADYSAFIVVELIETKEGMKKVIRHIVHEKGMVISGERDKDNELLDVGQIDILEDLSRRFNNCPVVVEKNNVGVALIQELRKRNVNVSDFTTDRMKKVGMIRYLVSEMQSGNIIIPEETEEVKKMKNELLNFGVKRTKTGLEKFEALAGHDDLVVALAIANFSSQEYGESITFAVCQD